MSDYDCYGCDLRLMSVATADGLASEGRNLVIVALVGTNLHIRIFDPNGTRVVDKAEDELMSGDTLTTLKKQLNPLPDKSDLSLEQQQKIIRDAISISGHTHCYTPGVMGRQIKDEIERAEDGDAEAARRLLQRFCGAIMANTDKNGNPYRTLSGTGTRIDERILRYLAECFQEILDDGPGARTDANKALNLTAADQKGRKKSRSRRQKVLDWGYEVYERVEQLKVGWALNLMSVATADGLAKEGLNLIIVAIVGTSLHIRIFDANGKRVVDKAENKLMSGDTLTTLKKQLNPLPDKSDLSLEQKQKIIQDATSIAGHPPKADKIRAPVDSAIMEIAKKRHAGFDAMKDAYDEFRRLVKAAEDEAKSLAEAASTPGDTDLIP